MIIEQLKKIGIVPVIKIDDANDAVPLAKALIEGGLPCAEVTFRTEAAADAIAEMSKNFPEMLVGAGTVLTTEQVDTAVEAGAKFIVSPGLNPTIVKYCTSKNIPIVPGCANASDIESALELGLETVKFFPAEPLGGIKMIQALKGPYTKLSIMPTGGVNAGNVNNYLQHDFIVACGGTWMIDNEAIKNKDFDKIKQLTQTAVKSMLNLQVKHVSMNAFNAQNTANDIASIINVDVESTTKGFLVDEKIEFVEGNKESFGTISIGANDLEKAVFYFENKGYEFNNESAQYTNNKLTAINFSNLVDGYEMQLVKN